MPPAFNCPWQMPGVGWEDTNQNSQKYPALFWLLALSSQIFFIFNWHLWDLTIIWQGQVQYEDSLRFRAIQFSFSTFHFLNLKTNTRSDSHLPHDSAADCLIVSFLNLLQIKKERANLAYERSALFLSTLRFSAEKWYFNCLIQLRYFVIGKYKLRRGFLLLVTWESIKSMLSLFSDFY